MGAAVIRKLILTVCTAQHFHARRFRRSLFFLRFPPSATPLSSNKIWRKPHPDNHVQANLWKINLASQMWTKKKSKIAISFMLNHDGALCIGWSRHVWLFLAQNDFEGEHLRAFTLYKGSLQPLNLRSSLHTPRIWSSRLRKNNENRESATLSVCWLICGSYF